MTLPAAHGVRGAAADRVVRVQLQQLHADLHADRRRPELRGRPGRRRATPTSSSRWSTPWPSRAAPSSTAWRARCRSSSSSSSALIAYLRLPPDPHARGDLRWPRTSVRAASPLRARPPLVGRGRLAARRRHRDDRALRPAARLRPVRVAQPGRHADRARTSCSAPSTCENYRDLWRRGFGGWFVNSHGRLHGHRRRHGAHGRRRGVRVLAVPVPGPARRPDRAADRADVPADARVRRDLPACCSRSATCSRCSG